MSPTSSSPSNQTPDLKKILETGSTASSGFRRLWIVVILVVFVGLGLFFSRSDKDTSTTRYKTEPAKMGTLVVTVSATGNLQPTNQVEVGSELSGIIERVFVDVNDQVHKDQMLARLDTSKLEDAVARSRASLATAEAQVLQAQATVAETKVVLNRYRHLAQLSEGKVPSKNEMDIAEANLKRAEANEASARAGVAQAVANLRSDETNLYKAGIRSPIDGVVLSREVEPGQTVAASFQAPVLFLLAEDLSKMELQVDVDEADVGQVHEGQKAVFSVDAYPGRRYTAIITRVSYGSQTKDGVVSYLTVLAVDNKDLTLRPGMTGTAEITTLTRENALLVPNAALRFSPPESGTETKRSGGLLSNLMPGPPGRMARPQSTAPVGDGASRVWVLRDGQPMPLEVRTGATDGRMTEIVESALEAGTQVITEVLGGTS